jgi:hypothetical protein
VTRKVRAAAKARPKAKAQKNLKEARTQPLYGGAALNNGNRARSCVSLGEPRTTSGKARQPFNVVSRRVGTPKMKGSHCTTGKGVSTKDIDLKRNSTHWQPQFMQQLREARVASKWIRHRFGSEIHQIFAIFFIRPVQPRERLVTFS